MDHRQRKISAIFSVIVLALVIALVCIHLLLPPFVLKKLNAELAEVSPIYSLRIGKLRLNLLRMAYRFENIEGHLKKSEKLFADIEMIDVSIAWSELVRGRFLTNINVNRAHLVLSPELLAPPPEATQGNLVKESRDAATSAADKMFPVRIASVRLRNSDIRFGDFLKQPNEPLWRVGEINGFLTNLNPTPAAPLSFFTIGGTMLGSAVLKGVGKLERLAQPMAWEADIEMQKFDLVRGNRLFVKYIPLSFSKGTLDLFGEVKSENNRMEGYLKPFMEDIEVLGDKNDFKGLQHFAVELVAGLGNLILRDPKNHTLAARIPFAKDGESPMSIDTDKALSTAVDNGFGKPIPRTLEDSVNLKLNKGQ